MTADKYHFTRVTKAYEKEKKMVNAPICYFDQKTI